MKEIIGWTLASIGICATLYGMTWYYHMATGEWKEAMSWTLITLGAVGLICGFIALVVWLIV